MDQIDDVVLHDPDPTETQEWLDSLSSLIQFVGRERASFLLERLNDSGRRVG